MSTSPLVARILALLPPGHEVRDVSMFGGRAIMLDGRMLVSAGRDGTLLVRVDPVDGESLVRQPGARESFMGAGRAMGPGWVTVDGDAVHTDAALTRWLEVALEFHARGA